MDGGGSWGWNSPSIPSSPQPGERECDKHALLGVSCVKFSCELCLKFVCKLFLNFLISLSNLLNVDFLLCCKGINCYLKFLL